MDEEGTPPDAAAPEGDEASPRELTPAARRALAEARERRDALDAKARAASPEPEVHGRGGKEPVRYGDWEIKGAAIDFS